MSLKSADTPESPNIPDSLFNINSISSGVKFSFFIKYVTIDGSKSPERAHIGIPPSGVSPIVVSTLFPPLTAHKLAPCPKWHTTVFNSSTGLPKSSAILAETYL